MIIEQVGTGLELYSWGSCVDGAVMMKENVEVERLKRPAFGENEDSRPAAGPYLSLIHI